MSIKYFLFFVVTGLGLPPPSGTCDGLNLEVLHRLGWLELNKSLDSNQLSNSELVVVAFKKLYYLKSNQSNLFKLS